MEERREMSGGGGEGFELCLKSPQMEKLGRRRTSFFYALATATAMALSKDVGHINGTENIRIGYI